MATSSALAASALSCVGEKFAGGRVALMVNVASVSVGLSSKAFKCFASTMTGQWRVYYAIRSIRYNC